MNLNIIYMEVKKHRSSLIIFCCSENIAPQHAFKKKLKIEHRIVCITHDYARRLREHIIKVKIIVCRCAQVNKRQLSAYLHANKRQKRGNAWRMHFHASTSGRSVIPAVECWRAGKVKLKTCLLRTRLVCLKNE